MPPAPKAFVLGAGLGTRLRPLTEQLPKPLVPVRNRPLIGYSFDHLVADLGVEEFLVNTHHCPGAYETAFPEGLYRGRRVGFRHEPVLLDTAGGIDNIRDWLPSGESFVVFNGDILTSLPLGAAWSHHLASGNVATLVLRSTGDELRVGFDSASGRIVDLRQQLLPDWPERFQFTGIYFLSPEFLGFLQPGKIESVVLPLLEAIRSGAPVGGFVADEGEWSDLGERDSYLDAQAVVAQSFPERAGPRIHPKARVDPSARIDEISSIGPDAVIGPGATIVESVVWGGGIVAPGARLRRVVVRTERAASGILEAVDL